MNDYAKFAGLYYYIHETIKGNRISNTDFDFDKVKFIIPAKILATKTEDKWILAIKDFL